MSIKKGNPVSAFRFKNVSREGNLSKTLMWVLEDGTVYLNQIFLIDGNEEIRGMEKMYTRWGKSLYLVAIGIKAESLHNIMQGWNQTLLSGRIKLNKK